MTAIRLAVALVCLGVATPLAAGGTASQVAVAPGTVFPTTVSPTTVPQTTGFPATVPQVTFDEALAAARRTPRLVRLAADVEAAQAGLVAARTYPHNPELELEVADRDGADGSTTDRGAGVSQTFEVAGQSGKRRQAALAALEAARGSYRQARVEVLGDVARAFAAAVHGRQLLAIEEAEAELARSFAALIERRLEAGSATAVDLALARAGLARAERGLALGRGSYRRAQARLAEGIGAAGTPLLAPQGDLPPLPPPLPLDQVLARAATMRGDVAAAEARLEAAQARRRLAGALRFPDVTVGARAGREEGDDVAGVSFRVPIPLFDRNQGGIAEAEAEITAARSEVELAQLAVRQEVAAAYGLFEAGLAAVQATEELGVTPLEEGLALLERSFEAGKIGSAELLLYRRELVEGRRQAVAAAQDAWEAALDLAVATGGGILPGVDWSGEETER